MALDYARDLGDAIATAIIETGVIDRADQARALARFYWRMVDASIEEDVEVEMENLHNAFSAACYQAGFADIWHSEIPDD
ncbi:MAG TPA: hypothetical protein VF286_11710 [Acidiphilium sp.]